MEMGEPAYVLEDRRSHGDWRVEKVNDDGGVEVVTFAGPNARQRAIQYAERQYREFEEIS